MGTPVREVVRDVVAAVAPQELSLLDGLSELSEGRVTHFFAGPDRREDLLGFGLTEVSTLVTPVVWMAVDETARRALGAAVDSSARRASATVRRVLRRPPQDPPPVAPLTPDQLDVVHQRVRELASASSIGGPQAEALADAVVSRLARRPGGAPDSGTAHGRRQEPEPEPEPAPEPGPGAEMAGKKERELGDGTTRRFLLLLFLLVVSSQFLLYAVASRWRDRTGYDRCMDAAITGPDGRILPLVRDDEVLAFGDRADACEHTLLHTAYLQALCGTALVLLATFVLYLAIPRWRGREGRLRTVGPGSDPELYEELLRLTGRAGLARPPRFAVDPRALTAGAVVFGRGRRLTVCLHAGLPARRTSDPRQFEAVVLHELAHVENADIGMVYASVALGRVFLVAVLLPYAFFQGWLLLRGHVPGSSAPLWKEQRPKRAELLFAVLLALQVQWARADILRHRELCADREAVGWGPIRRCGGRQREVAPGRRAGGLARCCGHWPAGQPCPGARIRAGRCGHAPWTGPGWAI